MNSVIKKMTFRSYSHQDILAITHLPGIVFSYLVTLQRKWYLLFQMAITFFLHCQLVNLRQILKWEKICKNGTSPSECSKELNKLPFGFHAVIINVSIERNSLSQLLLKETKTCVTSVAEALQWHVLWTWKLLLPLLMLWPQ